MNSFFSKSNLSGNILIIDDDPSISKLIKKFLERNNHSIMTADTGEKALEKIQSNNFDIIITDFILPGIDGMHVLEEAKKTNSEVDVILVTGYGSIESAVEFMKAGALDYITKPINKDHLNIVIQKALERKELIKAARERDMYRELSLTDGLTGTYNHKYFKDQLSREIEKARRSGRNLSIIMLDIDNFKTINDNFGHQTGDVVLKGISSNISGACRSYDTISRYGGEEFGIILPDTPIEKAETVASRILDSISSDTYEQIKKPVTASIGISSYPAHAESRKNLIKKADIALYHSKESGKNRLTVYNRDIDNFMCH